MQNLIPSVKALTSTWLLVASSTEVQTRIMFQKLSMIWNLSTRGRFWRTTRHLQSLEFLLVSFLAGLLQCMLLCVLLHQTKTVRNNWRMLQRRTDVHARFCRAMQSCRVLRSFQYGICMFLSACIVTDARSSGHEWDCSLCATSLY